MSTIKHVLLSTLILCSMNIKSQIGINTLTPDASAALDIQLPAAQNKGILIPRLGQSQRIGIPLPAKGLMVFDTTDNLFYVNLTARVHDWYAVNPWMTKATASAPNSITTHSTITNVGIGVANPTARLDVNGNIKSNSTITANTLSSTNLNVGNFPPNSLVPAGAIIMWSGSISSIPSGWALCNGAGGTPNLSGKFIVGFSSASPLTPNSAPNDGVTENYGAIGNTGGEKGHKLLSTESGLPAHSHTSPPHKHGYYDVNETSDANTGASSGGAADANEDNDYKLTDDTTAVINNATPQDASVVHENRPPYYVLAYIIKLP